MEFFETFWTWLDGQLGSYIGDNTTAVARALGPTAVVAGSIYVMLWGYLQLSGKIEEPFSAGLKRIVTLAIVFGVGLQLWLYNSVIVDTFYAAPAQLAGAVVGANEPVEVIDTIWARGATVAENLADRTTWRSGWDFTIMAYVIRLMIGALCVYTMFLIALSKVALAVLLALGPLFVILLLFDQTKHYFSSWIAQLSNYALVTILTIMVCALMLGIVQKYATDTLGLGAEIRTVDALNMLLVSALAFLFMMQVPQIAGSLSGGGTGLNTFGFGRGAWRKGVGLGVAAGALGVAGGRRAGGFVRGMLSRETAPRARENWSAARSAGYQARMKIVNRNSIEARP